MYNFIKSIICGFEPGAINEFAQFENFFKRFGF